MTPSKKHPVRIELTPEQREQVKQAIGQDVVAMKLTPEQLEERVAPAVGKWYPASVDLEVGSPAFLGQLYKLP